MNNKKNPIVSLIVKMCIYFILTMVLTSVFLFIYVGILYSTVTNIPQQTEIILENLAGIENLESSTNATKTTNNSFIIVERNRNYKIYVDIETRNMYIAPNTYPSEAYTMMYDGDKPKIYTDEINGETYEMFLDRKK